MASKIGVTLLVIGLAIFVLYTFGIYIPALDADPTNNEAILSALIIGCGCGILSTIGAVLAKKGV